jgi:hypothetical protein
MQIKSFKILKNERNEYVFIIDDFFPLKLAKFDGKKLIFLNSDLYKMKNIENVINNVDISYSLLSSLEDAILQFLKVFQFNLIDFENNIFYFY